MASLLPLFFFLGQCFAFASALSAIADSPCLQNPDVTALLAFKNSILSDPLHVLATWNCSFSSSAGAPCNLWTGVTCESNRVVDINLSGRQLVGTISPSLAQLSRLRSLNLSNNSLTGAIPVELGNCSSLITVDLSSNALESRIPSELGMLHKLQYLNLQVNSLTGVVPSALANCTSLTHVGMYSNRLSGPIPAEFGMLSKLQFLSLGGNNFTGSVPSTLGNCTELTALGLFSTQLSGSVPEALGKLTKLQTLLLWDNLLTGRLPSALGNCTALIDVEFSTNRLSGSIPEAWGKLNKLQVLFMDDNMLTGTLGTLANCSALFQVQLQVNQLSGSVPAELGALSNLSVLSLGGNNLTGAVPALLANGTALTKLDLRYNYLSGSIPMELGLSGSIPESLGTLRGLVQLDLSHNNLIGQVSPGLGLLTQLTVLDFSWNQLSGGIRLDLGNALQLQLLNLSHNNLTGTLPSSFSSLLGLVTVDVSYNQLAGGVPNAFPYNNTTIVNLVGNPLLCGQIVNRSCNVTDQASMRRGSSKHLKLIVSVAIVSALVGLVIFGIMIWRHRSKRLEDRSEDLLINDAFEKKYVRIPADELQAATDGFSEANVLGRGGVSTVYKGVLAGQKVPTAIKVLKTDHLAQTITEDQVARLKREVEMLAKVRHRNIVRVLGCCFNLETQAIILELMPNGNLDTYLHGKSKRNAPSREEKLRVLHGIAKGLEYLHHFHDPAGRSIVHCDVKPANILLDEDWEPRIADFGIAKLLEQEGNDGLAQQSASMLLRGSVGYIPPEYAFSAEVSTAGDVYSFGVVMLEVLTGKRPTDVLDESAGTHETLMAWVKAADPKQLQSLFDGTPGLTVDEARVLAQMALSCTSHHPLQRPTILRVAEFLSDIANPHALSQPSK